MLRLVNSGVFLGLVNLSIVTIYLAVFWVICEAIVWLLRKLVFKDKRVKLYFAGILALTVTISYMAYGYYNAHHVVITEYTVTTGKEVESLKIALIADSHISSTFDGKEFGEYVDIINSKNPDAVIIAGDFIDGSSKENEVLEAVNNLGRLESKYGTFFAFGNHDKNYYGEEQNGRISTEAFKNALVDNGVCVLEDEMIQISPEYTIIGRSDKVNLERESISTLMKEADISSFIIDINHQPNDYDNESAAGVDLVL